MPVPCRGRQRPDARRRTRRYQQRDAGRTNGAVCGCADQRILAGCVGLADALRDQAPQDAQPLRRRAPLRALQGTQDPRAPGDEPPVPLQQ